MPAAHATQPLILIIDDVMDNVEVLMAILAQDYAVQYATSGREGLELVRRQRPDLILLDVVMPEMSGYEVFEALKAQSLTASIPVIFVTARNDAVSETAAFSAGAADFIHKPVTPAVVRARISQQLSLARTQSELERMVLARTTELAAERDRANSANRAKSAFLANMNHELRTPLNHVIGMAGVLLRAPQSDANRNALEKIRNSGRNLLALVEDLIEVSRIEAGELQLVPAAFDLQRLLDTALQDIQPQAQAKGLQLRKQVEPGLPASLQGDARQIASILGQLLSNAVKFSDAGTITLAVQALASRHRDITLRFAVQDQGPGIAEATRAGIFELFNQGDNSSTRKAGGTGLGLTICKRLVDLMAGELSYSTQAGQGSTFWFALTLPLAAEPATAGEGAPVLPANERLKLLELAALMVGLLADDDVYALVLHQERRDALEPLLQAQFAAYAQALESVDFDTALRLLRAALAAR